MPERKNDIKPVIGLEIHVELLTETKAFCSCPASFGGEPNTNTCPVCRGEPGALPVLNRHAVELAVMAGLALGCSIHEISAFDRKNYYYPDLPKGYQITQYFHPVCTGGAVPITLPDGRQKKIGLERIHIEEDAGKLTHRGDETLVDYNRAGVPLIEIVSLPEIESAEEAKAYVESIRRILSFIGVSDCKMNEGSMRADVNVSVVVDGDHGERSEIKNVNSINYIGKAVEYEIKRQSEMLLSGERPRRETRRYNEDKSTTEHIRYKEETVDYRYFPEPNIPQIRLTGEDIDRIRGNMRIMPEEAERYIEEKFGFSEYAARRLTSSYEIYEYFLEAAGMSEYPNHTANLIIGEIITKTEKPREYLAPSKTAAISDMFGRYEITSVSAKKLVSICSATGESPVSVAEKEKMMMLTDPDTLKNMVEEAVKESPKSIEDYIKGKDTALKQIMGVVMRKSGGRAEPRKTMAILEEYAKKLRNGAK